jgi:cyclic pyranopterin phosphate synthase
MRHDQVSPGDKDLILKHSPASSALISAIFPPAAREAAFAGGGDSPLPGDSASALVDGYGRQITYLRLSITDRCDFRCAYCMGRDTRFLPRDQVMRLEECLRVAQIFVDMGVTKLRVTGGEPLARPNAPWLLRQLGQLEKLKELTLTTNASQLARFAPELKAAGVGRLNISLDTLRPDRFAHITRTGSLEKVRQGIDAAHRAGFWHTRLNTVMMKGVNDDEFVALTQFALDGHMDIAFIEEMPIGAIAGRARTYISSDETLALLQRHFDLEPSPENSGGPARYWRVPGSQNRVGFISARSHDFCASCNRVRVSARGELYPCLGHNDAVALLPLLRQFPDNDAALRQRILETLGVKPERHDFTRQMENPQVTRFMSAIGG